MSALSGEIGDVSVATGEPATFVCNALKRDTDFSISWKVEGETYTCGGTDTSSDNIHCYMKNETACVLKIENTAALDIRSHSVECILQNFVPENFREDCVSLPRGSCDVTKSATLEISNGPTPPTVTSSESHRNTHTHTHCSTTLLCLWSWQHAVVGSDLCSVLSKRCPNNLHAGMFFPVFYPNYTHQPPVAAVVWPVTVCGCWWYNRSFSCNRLAASRM